MNSNNKLAIKNMVCARCIKVVQEELEKLGFKPTSIILGEVSIESSITSSEMKNIKEMLWKNGFELIEDSEVRLIETVKTLVIDHIHHSRQKPESLNFSDYLSQKTNTSYFYISKLFSAKEGITLEKYIIKQKIERVKELLMYGSQTLSEIAFELEYSSTAHLSGQFKKETGLTPTKFKQLKPHTRRPLDNIT
ncbi:MAG: AraC family transcriptional regulator [Bacteroidia bacterium]|nr:AraC family transcriptional regulator [Bacteroidia bacterium]